MCDHLHDSTSRYDAVEKVMTFLLVCRTCGIERVVETLDYEPRPVWTSPGTAPRQPADLEDELAVVVTSARPLPNRNHNPARRAVRCQDRPVTAGRATGGSWHETRDPSRVVTSSVSPASSTSPLELVGFSNGPSPSPSAPALICR